MPENTDLMDTMLAFFRREAASKKLWSQYEHRPQQEEMARAVWESLQNKEILCVEAGTGVGKTLAYLLPLLFFAEQAKVRVAISTETKSLQQQILKKDLPVARSLLGKPIHAELCLGTANFVCKRRLEDTLTTGQLDPTIATENLDDFLKWEQASPTGIRQEYHGPLSPRFWNQINRDPLDCLGSRCPHYERSPYFVARRRWQKATLLVVNHSLLASHFALETKLLPGFQYLVVDEAHRFPEILQNAFTLKGSLHELRTLLNEVAQTFPAFLAKEKKLSQDLDALHNELAKIISDQTKKSPRIQTELPFPSGFNLINALEKLEKDLEQKLSLLGSQQELDLQKDQSLELSLEELQTQTRLSRAGEFRRLLEKLIADKEAGEVVWIEKNTKNEGKGSQINDFSIFCAPLSSGSFTQEKVFSQMSAAILTSATLTTNTQSPFAYFTNELGFDPENGPHCLKLASPFDYKQQALLYLPQNIADPVHAEEQYHQNIAKEIQRLLQLSKGGAFVLFTSTRSLKLTQNLLQINPEYAQKGSYKIFSQTSMGSDAALQAFKESKHGVLLGLATFWQGIDMPGDRLRMVILTRIPFRVPDEPILAARLEAEKQAGQNPFLRLQLPPAVLSMRQGLGRLIRSSEDRGAIAFLDPRLHHRSYGKDILKVLPPARRYTQFTNFSQAYRRLFSTASPTVSETKVNAKKL